MGIRKIISVYALAIGLALGAGLASTTARADGATRLDMGTAAAFAKPSAVSFCIYESKVAWQIAEAIRDGGWGKDEVRAHLRFPIKDTTPEKIAEQNLFIAALVNDVFNASDFVLANLLLSAGIQGDPVTAEEYPARVAQVVLEACGYEYGKLIKEGLDQQLHRK